MLFSKKYRFIFFHTPKVAGSSITKALRKYSNYPNERIYNYMIDYLGEIPAIGLYPLHISPIDLYKKLKNKNTFDTFLKIAFVRNPWDWHVSQFNYHKQNRNAFFFKTFQKFSFREYIDWATDPENIKKARSSQFDFLSNNQGELMVDFIGRYENLQEDFNKICDKLQIDEKIPIVNTSKRNKNYREYYDDYTKNKIEDTFKKDLEKFNYNF
ncbi:Sulfotransferase family protein [Reichenbachiella faecimaris]|uniref:Sulfotransferase family protein n=1 Tax=Reichenbachiella faecimaris TaxID=692418 RepID=A0A1W2GIV0_REIFA|nr:sulfotransferase family 2 domain-containing protein [Reichenbachiella faecimaris]SMD36464.1 Sulfotransferase family protein [Reichenbachiella faecimaris]